MGAQSVHEKGVVQYIYVSGTLNEQALLLVSLSICTKQGAIQ